MLLNVLVDLAKKFKNFRVNYIKNNIQRYKTYMVKDNQYYLVINEQVDDSGEVVKECK